MTAFFEDFLKVLFARDHVDHSVLEQCQENENQTGEHPHVYCLQIRHLGQLGSNTLFIQPHKTAQQTKENRKKTKQNKTIKQEENAILTRN